jgi:hypothetical protein
MDKLLAAIAADLQFVPASADRVQRVALVVEANNARVARAGLMLGEMEDNPGAFDSWCRAFATSADSP